MIMGGQLAEQPPHKTSVVPLFFEVRHPATFPAASSHRIRVTATSQFILQHSN
jgi:hypothetical protein